MTECPIISRTKKSNSPDKVYENLTQGGLHIYVESVQCRKTLLGELCQIFPTKLWITNLAIVWIRGHLENFCSSKLFSHKFCLLIFISLNLHPGHLI